MALTPDQEDILAQLRIARGWDVKSPEWESLYELALDDWEAFQAIAREALAQSERGKKYMPEQLSFDLGQAKEYMEQYFILDRERGDLNARINDARTIAREQGVPTKAVEAAIRVARARRKCGLSVPEFEELIKVVEEVAELLDEANHLHDVETVRSAKPRDFE